MQNKKLQIILFFLIFFGLFALAKNSQAVTLYVDDNNCSDSRTYAQVQSPTTPWCTIQKAADNVVAGDTVIVKDGTYTDTNKDNYIVWLKKGGTESNWITFKAEHKWGAVLDGQNFTSTYGFSIGQYETTGFGYVRIEGFEVKNTKQGGFGIPGLTVVHDIYYYGNKVHGIGQYRQIGLCSTGDAINGRSAFGAGSKAHHITIDNNLIYDIGRLPGGDCPAHDYNHDHGLYITASYITIINNVFYNCLAGWGINVDGRDTSTDWLISNNTLYGYNPDQPGQIILWTTLSNITIQNNISYGSNTSFVDGHWQTDSKKNININNNLVYGAGVLNVTHPEYHLSGNLTGQDPKFVNLTNKDFHLQSTSPAIGKGFLTNAPTLDFDGVPRGSSIDIGAYEYVGSDTTPPATPTGLRVQ